MQAISKKILSNIPMIFTVLVISCFYQNTSAAETLEECQEKCDNCKADVAAACIESTDQGPVAPCIEKNDKKCKDCQIQCDTTVGCSNGTIPANDQRCVALR